MGIEFGSNELSRGQKMPELDLSAAVRKLTVLKHEVQSMGADVEPSHLDGLETQMLAGKLTPSEAVAEAERYLGGFRQDYH